MLTLLYPKKFCELETRKLSLQEMQMVEGVWSWSGCASGALEN